LLLEPVPDRPRGRRYSPVIIEPDRPTLIDATELDALAVGGRFSKATTTRPQ
jgi:hypothetical protein